MISASIEEYISIWPRVLPYMVYLFFVVTLSACIVTVLFMILVTAIGVKTHAKNIFQRRVPSRVYNLKGYYRNNGVSLFITFWMALILIPVISFIPIVIFDIRILIVEWLFINIPICFVLNELFVFRLHKKFEQPKLYSYPGGIGIQTFGNDFIIPNPAIKQLVVDTDLLWVVIRVKYRFVPVFVSQYFAFNSREELTQFRDFISRTVELPWDKKSYSSVFYKIIARTTRNVQIIDHLDLSSVLHSKTMKVLTRGNEQYSWMNEKK
jgi:hypothetical protein